MSALSHGPHRTTWWATFRRRALSLTRARSRERKLMFFHLLTLTRIETQQIHNKLQFRWDLVELSLALSWRKSRYNRSGPPYWTLGSDRSTPTSAVVVYKVERRDLKCMRREQPSHDAGKQCGWSNSAQQQSEGPYIILRGKKTRSRSSFIRCRFDSECRCVKRVSAEEISNDFFFSNPFLI